MLCQGYSWHTGIPARRLNVSPPQHPDRLGTQPRVLSLQIWISHLAILHSVTAVSGVANISCNFIVLQGLWQRCKYKHGAIVLGEYSFGWKTRAWGQMWKEVPAQKRGQSVNMFVAPLCHNAKNIPFLFAWVFPDIPFLFALSVVCKASAWLLGGKLMNSRAGTCRARAHTHFLLLSAGR